MAPGAPQADKNRSGFRRVRPRGAQGPNKSLKWSQKLSKNETKKTIGKREEKNRPSAPFWTILGSLLGAFSAQKSIRERPRSDF